MNVLEAHTFPFTACHWSSEPEEGASGRRENLQITCGMISGKNVDLQHIL